MNDGVWKVSVHGKRNRQAFGKIVHLPMRFSEIIGQQQIRKKLIQTVLDHRVSHAQLFFGPEGNEKLALAIAYAQFINCTQKLLPEGGFSPEEIDSCGTCPSCIKFQKIIHPDLHFVYPVSRTKKVRKDHLKSVDFADDWRNFLLQNDYHVGLLDWYDFIGLENKQGIINKDDCRDIISTLSYKSYESEYKVMIIWMAEKLNYAAAPTILKILEEPPEKTLFVLIAEDPEQIIPTIRSRTLLVKIPKMTVRDVQDYLVAKGSIGEREAGIIARQSSGNLKLALNRMKNIEEENYNFTTFRNWMRDCFSAKVPELITFAADIARIGRENQKSFLLYALKVIQSSISMGHGHEDLVFSDGEELTFIRNFSAYINPSNAGIFSELFNNALYHIERNAHPQTLFLDLSLQVVMIFKDKNRK
jgi:DNA polymerase III subunit delta'